MSEPGTHAGLVAHLRGFLDAFADAVPASATRAELERDLEAWTERLRADRVEESGRDYGHRPDLPSAGQATTPHYEVLAHAPPDQLAGTTQFSSFFLGGRGVAHGGTIPLLFDELFGRLANAPGMPAARTAYLTTQYLSVVRVGVPLTFAARTDRVEGRKRFLRAELRDGEVLCAEGEALFVTLRDGQP
ncbi:PaaI family thioesterase [Nocardioides panacisoli]|uniref:PaaI family thioesterase n=1 Tax=Nocardioides panacisoli TaxID=627624 RepID=UPI001C639DBE|nr:PaaI family thioesterase [Nocardioides panacisoli]QYJ03604.1 PaaI family thioesterase [Nocardioides panacisoli]